MLPTSRGYNPRIRTLAVMGAIAGWMVTAPSVRAQIEIDADRMTITTKNLIVGFSGGDIVRIINRLTGETYCRPSPIRTSLTTLGSLTPVRGVFRCTGWRAGGSINGVYPTAAMTTLQDLERTLTLVVSIDEPTQDISLAVRGISNVPGLKELSFGIRGIDMGTGRFVLPVSGGAILDKETLPESIGFEYPAAWQCQQALWQTSRGGLVLYSRDDKMRPQRITLANRAGYADLSISHLAPGPWPKADKIEEIEWRLNAYSGDWRVPALGYRGLQRFLRPAPPPGGALRWAAGTRAMLRVSSSTPEIGLLDAASKRIVADRTLICLTNWREKSARDALDFTPASWVRPFIERASALGFRTMLQVEVGGIEPTAKDFPRLKRFVVRDAMTGEQALAANDRLPIHPASRMYRSLVVERLRDNLTALLPDALLLVGQGTMTTVDGNGEVEDKSYQAGLVALFRALRTEYPGIALGSDSCPETLAPYQAFALARATTSSPVPYVPIVVEGSTLWFGSPSGGGAADLWYHPVLTASTVGELESGSQGGALARAEAFTHQDLRPDWAAVANGLLARFTGVNGASASVVLVGNRAQFISAKKVLDERPYGKSPAVTASQSK